MASQRNVRRELRFRLLNFLLSGRSHGADFTPLLALSDDRIQYERLEPLTEGEVTTDTTRVQIQVEKEKEKMGCGIT